MLLGCGKEEPVDPPVDSMKFEGQYYLEVANTNDLKDIFTGNITQSLSGDFSIEVWAAGGSTLPTQALAIFMAGNNNGGNEIGIYQGAYDSSQVIVFIDDRALGYFSVPGLDWRRKRMHHLCLVRNGEIVTFYFDGDLLGMQIIANLKVDIQSSHILFGADYDPPGLNSNVGNLWVGYLDEIRLWSKALTSREVHFRAHHPDKLMEHYSVDDLLKIKGLWRFDHSVNGAIPDESGNANHARLRGASTTIIWDTFGAH